MTYDDKYNLFCDFSKNCLEMERFKKTSEWIGIDISFTDVYVGFLSERIPNVIFFDKEHTDELSLVGANYFARDLLKVRRLEKENQPDDELETKNTVKAVIGISEAYSSEEKLELLEAAKKAGLENVQLLYKSYAAALAKHWDEKNTAEITIASCVFRRDSFGISMITIKDGVAYVKTREDSFDVSIITIKNGIFYVKNRNVVSGSFDNHAIKEICLNTIRQIDLKTIDEVLIVGKEEYVTHEKPLIKAVRSAFGRLFGEACNYVRGHEDLVAKGLALYGNAMSSNEPVVVEDLPKNRQEYSL